MFDYVLGIAVLLLGLNALADGMGIGRLREDVRKILKRERAALEGAVDAAPGRTLPLAVLAEFDRAWPEVKGE
jgi:hypothetical protein